MNTTLPIILLIVPTVAFAICIANLIAKLPTDYILPVCFTINALSIGLLAHIIGTPQNNGRPCAEKDLPTNTIQTPVGISEYSGKNIVTLEEENSNVLRAVFTTKKLNLGHRYSIKTTPDGEMLILPAEHE